MTEIKSNAAPTILTSATNKKASDPNNLGTSPISPEERNRIAKDTEKVLTLWRQADLHYGSNDFARAAKLYVQCLTSTPDEDKGAQALFRDNAARSQIGLGSELYKLSKYGEAIASYDKARVLAETGSEIASTASKNIITAYSKWSSSYCERKDFTTAIKVLENALKLEWIGDVETATLHKLMANTCNNAACEALGAKNFSEAISYLTKGLSFSPNNTLLKDNLVATYNNAGCEALRANNFTEAIASLRNGLNFSPNNSLLKSNLAAAYNNAGCEADLLPI